MAALDDEDPEVRIAAGLGLCQLRPAVKGKDKAFEVLQEALKSHDDNVRRSAIKALAQLGPAAASITPELISGLKDANAGIRQVSALALARIGAAEERYAVSYHHSTPSEVSARSQPSISSRIS